ncbi:DoxX family protein [Mycobacterium deserti]|uniref:DoxX family protein n=1 Tax=Mycobacterium deserti TaxID=2978347 RepID=A0ABT2MC94_9MYCO|nr:DoxX family protein [Mycobacterium deserti]MCT7659199.1 DoxX family protein [Mycobacterium deserti]
MTSHPHDPRAWQRPDDGAGRPASASLVDPEDDLPSANYGGDFETTAIPSYDSTATPQSAQGFGLLNDPEPLPYVQPSGRHAMTNYPIEPTEIEPEAAARADRRGTQDLGLLVLRLAIGAMLIAHGLQKAFGLWGGPGLNGFEESLTDMGFRYADILTYVATGGQIAAGVLLVLGLFTPVAAAGALAYLVTGVLAEAMMAHEEARLSAFLTDGHEYKVFLVCAVAALVLTGPGRYGFDAGRGWARRPFVGSFVALLVGVGAGVAVWVLFNGGNPLA